MPKHIDAWIHQELSYMTNNEIGFHKSSIAIPAKAGIHNICLKSYWFLFIHLLIQRFIDPRLRGDDDGEYEKKPFRLPLYKKCQCSLIKNIPKMPKLIMQSLLCSSTTP